MANEFKVTLVGNKRVGKTSWIGKLITGRFYPGYEESLGVMVAPVTVRTNYGNVTLYLWDSAGSSVVVERHYYEADAVIIAVASDDQHGQEKVDMFKTVSGNYVGIEPVVVATKAEQGEPHFTYDFNISIEFGISEWEPIFHLVRELMGKPDLVFL